MSNAIETHRLTKRYGTQTAVSEVTFSVPTGAIFGFLGPNGAGKTTTIRMLLRLTKPSSGSAKVLGTDISQPPPTPIGAIVETPAILGYLSGSQNLDVLARTTGLRLRHSSISELLAKVGLQAAGNKRAASYSLGMKQRLGVAMALIGDPPLLFLDEPTNGLDPVGASEMRSLLVRLRAEGKTIFLSTHLLSEMEQVCTHVGIIHGGRLLTSGSLLDLLKPQGLRLRVDAPTRALQFLPGAVESNGWIISPDHTLTILEAARLLDGHGVQLLEATPDRTTLESLYFDTLRAA